jgi:MFS family permease
VALSGISLARFWSALVLLGLGWNLAFVGATTMVTDCYRPIEKAKVQGINDLCVFGSVALASLLSGVLFQNFGWQSVNLTIFPFVTLALILIFWLANMEKRAA